MIATLIMLTATSASDPTVTDLLRRMNQLETQNAILSGQVAKLTRELEDKPQATTPEPPAQVPLQDEASAQTVQPLAQRPAWDHAYVGFQDVYQRYNLSSKMVAPGYVLTHHGYGFGLQVGRRWQAGPLVAGIELDALKVHGYTTYVVSTQNRIFQHNTHYKGEGSIKGDLGFAYKNSLFYGFAGISTFIYNNTAYRSNSGNRNSESLILGLGESYKILPNISIELEGQHGFSAQYDEEGAIKSDNSLSFRINYLIP